MRHRSTKPITLFQLATGLMLYACLALVGLTLFVGASTVVWGPLLINWLAPWVGFGIWRVGVVILCLMAGGVLMESIR